MRSGFALHGEGAGEGVFAQGVAMVDLASSCEPNGPLPTPTHLKIDVDGPELEVLQGAEQLLHGGVLRHVLVEVAEHDGHQIDRILRAAGFELSAAGRLVGERTFAQNRIYERRDVSGR